MGANFISMEIKANNEELLKRKFNKVVAEYTVRYGNDPYSGTWAAVHGLKVITYPNAPKRWTKKAKWAALDYVSNEAEKWEQAVAIKTSTGYLIGAWAAS